MCPSVVSPSADCHARMEAQTALSRWVDAFMASVAPTRRVWEPGMDFGDAGAWWGKRKARRTMHEGVDIVLADPNVALRAPIWPIESGLVVCVMDDFIGRTAILQRPSNAQQFWVYGHMILEPTVQLGAWLTEGETLGRMAPSSTSCPAHLHISLLERAVTASVAWADIASWPSLHSSTSSNSGLRFVPIAIAPPPQDEVHVGVRLVTCVAAVVLAGCVARRVYSLFD